MCSACEQPVEGRPFCRDCFDIRRRDQLIQSIQNLQPSEETVLKVKTAAMAPMKNKEARRVAALAVDGFVSVLAALPVSLCVYGLSLLLMPVVRGLPFGLCYYGALFLTGGFYYIYAHWRWGRTIGKRALGLRVERMDGKPVTLTGAFWRFMGFIAVFIWAGTGWAIAFWIIRLINKANSSVGVPNRTAAGFMMLSQIAAALFALFFSLGALITFIGKHKRGFHDIIGGTVVKADGWEAGPREVPPVMPGR